MPAPTSTDKRNAYALTVPMPAPDCVVVDLLDDTALLTWLAVVMVDWRQLRDVYGSASDVPLLLEDTAASTDWNAPCWQELWSRLYHQGSVAPASYAALPRLAEVAGARPDVAMDPALVLFASILAAADGRPETTDTRSRYAFAVAALIPVAEHKLDLVEDRTDIIYALQAIAALEDLSVWQRQLHGLADEEVELECPACGDHIYLELVGDTIVATADPDDTRQGRVVRAAHPEDLAVPEARLLDLCQVHGHTRVAAELLHLFGQVTCPHCQTQFHVADAFC
jgi:hypothetical protein